MSVSDAYVIAGASLAAMRSMDLGRLKPAVRPSVR
jgi:hypothetical protein